MAEFRSDEKPPDAAVDDEGIPLAIAKEANPTGGGFAADRILTEEVNKVKKSFLDDIWRFGLQLKIFNMRVPVKSDE